jgi:uncharacterized membrane protein YbhN (UPF0104 family)
MTATAVRTDLATPERRLFAIFSSAGDQERRRRPADVGTFVLAVLLVAAGARQRSQPSPFGTSVVDLLQSLPDWAKTLMGGAFALASIYAVFVVVMAMLARDRPGLVRDLLVAVGLAVLAGAITGRVVTGSWPALESAVNSAGPRFPVLRVAIVAAVVATAAPHLVRPARRIGYTAVVIAAAGAIALGLGALGDVLAGFGVGLGVAAIVHFAFGSPAGAPSLFRVRRALLRLGIDAGEFTQTPTPRGAIRLRCTDGEGRELDVKVYGRDAADSQLLAKTWRFLWYRQGGGSLSVTRWQQVEHEALATLLAQRAHVSTADLVATGSTASGDMLLVTAPVFDADAVVALGAEHMESLWMAVAALRAARLAHGRIDGNHVLAGSDRAVAIEDWAASDVEAAEDRLNSDLGAALALSAAVVGADAAIEIARRHAGDDALLSSVAFVQPAAFTGSLRRTVKAAHLDLDALRAAAAASVGETVPELVRLQRVKWTSLLMTAITLAAVWFLISQIADIGWSTIVDAFEGASWGWIFVALIVGQTPRLGDALSILGACDQPLPYGPTVGLVMSISFINLAIPSTAARVATEVRYFQKQGVAIAKALTFGALDSVALFITQLSILIVTVGFGLTTLDFSLNEETISPGMKKVAALVVVAFAVGLIVLLAVPKLRRWALHLLSQGFDALRGLGSIRRWGPLFGGNLISQIMFSVTLGICVLAFGYHVSLVNLLAINVVTSFFAGLMPVPGGIGVTEAALTAGLVAAGVPQGAALSAVLVYRVVTYYLPPLWGWFAMRWLRQHDYL